MKGKAVISVVVVAAFLILGFVTSRGFAQSPRPEWSATLDEVRDAERIRSARTQIDQQAQMLVVRAQTRLKKENLSYDFDKLVWYQTASVASVVTAAEMKGGQ